MKYCIELFEEQEKVSFYTIRMKGCRESETEKFIHLFPEGTSYENEFQRLIAWIDRIGKCGALERYFRPESKMNDDIYAIPIEISKLRLYLIRISDGIVILGNGGIKPSRTYQQDSHLNHCVNVLSRIEKELKIRIAHQKVKITEIYLSGDLKNIHI